MCSCDIYYYRNSPPNYENTIRMDAHYLIPDTPRLYNIGFPSIISYFTSRRDYRIRVTFLGHKL